MDSARWTGFEPRRHDIFVCTPSKCGTTWMQNIVANLLWPDGDIPGSLFVISPWIEATFAMPADVMHQMLAAQTHRRAMKSHSPADCIPWFDDAKYITVARDGRDAFMSWCNHVSRMKLLTDVQAKAASEGISAPARFDGDYSAYFKQWLAGENNFFDVVSTYWERRGQSNLLFAHYNDMKADLEGEMRRVAAFLEIDVPESKWPTVVERCTFESMRNSGTAIGDFDRMFDGGLQGFIFKGTNGRWRDVLTAEDLELYRQKVTEALPNDCARWVEGGRHAIGLR
jgi:aryl sulfotransferase